MVIYVLDASALLRFLFTEAGDQRVQQILKSARDSDMRVLISAVNWAEVVNKLTRRYDFREAEAVAATLTRAGVQIVAASAERATRAGMIVAQQKLGFADAFCLELASDSPDRILVTADFDFKLVEHIVKVEFLPTKSIS